MPRNIDQLFCFYSIRTVPFPVNSTCVESCSSSVYTTTRDEGIHEVSLKSVRQIFWI
ncbi:unnamed protein product [Schistosoma curassoni]|uniref:ZP domain-containing protein n=1 Tax=Schistosoma curassoni TaxID=6186 RepID=A0A183KT56_9TREM|nr:unnamed protein product [Schistosoma curassoni]